MSDRLQGGADLSVLRPKTDLRSDEYNYAEKVYQHVLVFNLNNTSYFVSQDASSPLQDRMEDDPTYSDGITYLSRNIPCLKTCSLIQDEKKKAACYKGNDCGLPDNWLFDGYLDIAIRAGSYSRNLCGATELLTNIFGPASLPSEAKLFSPWAGVQDSNNKAIPCFLFGKLKVKAGVARQFAAGNATSRNIVDIKRPINL